MIKLVAIAIMLFASSVFYSEPVLSHGVDDFIITRYEIDLYLGKDKDGRSTLRTEELIVATFPAENQNHGIERAIPTSFDGHPVGLQIASVTDESGQKLNYTTYDSNNNKILRIGDADRFVHGEQTYRIAYSQRDVTKYFANTNADEFYWDTNGTQWRTPINNFTARLHIDGSLAAERTGKQRCYQGQSGAAAACQLSAEGSVLLARAPKLNPGENVTLAAGFAPQTFAGYQQSATEKLVAVWIVLALSTGVLSIFLLVWLCVRYGRQSNRLAERKIVVPEFLPPKNASVSVAASIVRKRGSIFSAQLLDMAVRHYLKIYQTSEKKWYKPAGYQIEIVKDISDLRSEEKEVLTDIFDSTTIGARLDMSSIKRSWIVRHKLSDNQQKVDTSIAGKYRLRARDHKKSAWFKRFGLVSFVLSILLMSPGFLVVAVCAWIMAYTLRPLTNNGLTLARHLAGLEAYIKVAEAERLRVLQSPEGAAKVGIQVDEHDKRQLIKLYERVLPYAVLFGQEKQWNQVLGKYYEELNESPRWYYGYHGTFNAALFAASMSDFNHVVSYSDPTNASSGGSGGGGFSGGGGGGGGGGGW